MISKQGVIRKHNESKTVLMGGNIVTFILDGDDTGVTYSLAKFIMAASLVPGPPVHIYGTRDEAVYILDGELEFRLGSGQPKRQQVRSSLPLKVAHTMFPT